MSQDYSFVRPDHHGQFDKTRWSMVLEAVQSQAPGASQALAELSRRYWPPLYSFARRRGRSPEDAQDLVQGFFEHLIDNRGLATVDRSKGRFRSFLLASFQNFRAAEIRTARAEKRGGRAELIRLDWRDAEARLVFEPEDRLTPETPYDAQWALLLLRRATERLQQEQRAKGKGETFQILRGFLGGAGGGCVPVVTYEEAARTSEGLNPCCRPGAIEARASTSPTNGNRKRAAPSKLRTSGLPTRSFLSIVAEFL